MHNTTTQKTILITGATDGIGLETARTLVEQGHHVLLHGRNPDKLAAVAESLQGLAGTVEQYVADLSNLDEVAAMVQAVKDKHQTLDVLINNAGVLKTNEPILPNGLDVRFVVNTLVPYVLTQGLLPLMSDGARIVNLSSAAQAPVDLEALAGRVQIADDLKAYAQSKLAITMWSHHLSLALDDRGILVVSVNPGSLLATKMVKDGFGVAGHDIRVGADILVRATLDDDFVAQCLQSPGRYFDNDARQFAAPHTDALDQQKVAALMQAIETLIN